MGEIVIAPQGRDAVDVGGFVDDGGKRFVGVIFKRDDGDPVIISFEAALFHDFAAHVGRVSKAVAAEDYWADVPTR